MVVLIWLELAIQIMIWNRDLIWIIRGCTTHVNKPIRIADYLVHNSNGQTNHMTNTFVIRGCL